MPDLVAGLSVLAQALSPEDRARLAEELIASLDPHHGEGESAWDEELRRRIDDLERGTVQLVPVEEAFAQVRGSLPRRQASQLRDTVVSPLMQARATR